MYHIRILDAAARELTRLDKLVGRRIVKCKYDIESEDLPNSAPLIRSILFIRSDRCGRRHIAIAKPSTLDGGTIKINSPLCVVPRRSRSWRNAAIACPPMMN